MGDRVTLADYVFRLIQQGKRDSAEFESLVSYYGLDRLRELYQQAKKEKDLAKEHHQSRIAESQKKWATKDAPGGRYGDNEI